MRGRSPGQRADHVAPTAFQASWFCGRRSRSSSVPGRRTSASRPGLARWAIPSARPRRNLTTNRFTRSRKTPRSRGPVWKSVLPMPGRSSSPGKVGLDCHARIRGWRRERDSNPRAPCGANGFQDRRHRPLGHPSAPSIVAPAASRTELDVCVVDVDRAGVTDRVVLLVAIARRCVPRRVGSARLLADRHSYVARMAFCPSMNGRSASGMTTEPSSCW